MSSPPRVRVGARLAIGLALSLVAPVGLSAQGLGSLDSLVAAGRVQEARRDLLAWWRERGATAPREELQQGLWYRGLLTLDPDQAAADYTRLVVEYPGGTFTARARLRLAQGAASAGDLEGAARHYRTLIREHPASPERLIATRWLERHQAELPETASGLVFSVQVGAFSTRAGADRVRSLALDAGFQPRLVRVAGSDLLRVRVGLFGNQRSAEDARTRLAAAGLSGVVVEDADREAGAG